MKKQFLVLLVTLFIIGCGKGQKFEENFNQLSVKELNLYNQQVVVLSDTIILDKVPSSYIGKLGFKDDKFYFVDEKFCRKYNFEKDGKFIDYNFNKGKSNKEVDSEIINAYTSVQPDKHCVFSNSRYFLYDNNYDRYKSGNIFSGTDKTVDPANPMIYSISYTNLIFKSYGNYIYYNMALSHPGINFIDHTTDFYNGARTLFVYDVTTDKIVAMLGKFPEMYINGDHNQFSLINFDVSKNGSIYLSFEADKNIRVYDASFKPTVSFGIEGKDMDVSYSPLVTYENFAASYRDHRAKYSYYKDIMYLEPFGFVARAYAKSIPDKDGLQIYNKDYDLVADLEVPKGSKLAGADSKYLYLYTINELSEEVQILKIKL